MIWYIERDRHSSEVAACVCGRLERREKMDKARVVVVVARDVIDLNDTIFVYVKRPWKRCAKRKKESRNRRGGGEID